MSRAALLAGLLGLAWSVQAQPADPLAQARALAAAGDYAAARARLEQRLAAAPDDAGARFWLARVLAWQGHPDQALPLYAALLDREPDNADYLLGLGQAQLWAGRAAEAVATLERAQRLAPAYVDVDRALAQARAAVASTTAPRAGTPSQADAIATPMPGGAVHPGPDAARSQDDARAAERAAEAERAAMPQAPAGSAAEVATAPVAAAGPLPLATRRSVGYSIRRDWLDHGLGNWLSQRVDVAAVRRGAPGVYGALVAERRFDRTDAGLELGAVLPLGPRWTLQPELGWVPGARVLPRHFLDLRLQGDAGGGWLGTASLRRSAYRDLDVDRLALGVERYAGAWRIAYTLNLTRLAGATATGHDLRVVRGYGEHGEIGVQLSAGREDALLGTRVVASDVRGLSLGGRHGLPRDWALRWNAGIVRQGSLYTRRGLSLGVERRF